MLQAGLKNFDSETERNGMNALFEKYIDSVLRYKIRYITELISQRDFYISCILVYNIGCIL